MKGKKLYWIILMVSFAVLYFILFKYGDKLNENQTLGAIVVASMIIIFSGICFWYGTFSIRNALLSNSKSKKLFIFSLSCFILSFFHLPIWTILSGQFPPRAFNLIAAIILATLVALSLVGPIVPRVIMKIKKF